ncbi:MAG TPA: ATP-binding protein, partial [Ideonella sp.]|nr:ATP-binding protein [Ideonella sp.]
ASVRARNLVRQILTFSRREPQELLTQPLGPIVDETHKLLRATLPARVELDAALQPTPLFVNADATQIQQVLVNLCTNGWYALQGRAGRIAVGLERVMLEGASARRLDAAPGAYAHLSVSDTGCGMDEATRQRIFEPFFTTKPVGEGTGLGLAVVHGIVATHGGAITAESAPGQGSRFHLYLPLAQPLLPLAAPASAGPPRVVWGHGEPVLYLDDDEVMRVMVERLLQRAGFDVRCCRSARDALAAVSAAAPPFSVVVTDFNMPDASGLDLARELACLQPALPVVIVSGYLSEELRQGSRQLGVRCLLEKQQLFEQLAPAIGRLLAATGTPTERTGR